MAFKSWQIFAFVSQTRFTELKEGLLSFYVFYIDVKFLLTSDECENDKTMRYLLALCISVDWNMQKHLIMKIIRFLGYMPPKYIKALKFLRIAEIG